MSALAEQSDLARPMRLQPDPQARAARRARAIFWDRVMTVVLWALAVALVGLLAYIILYLLVQGLGSVSLKFLTTAGADGVAVQLYNTFYVIGLALLICIPLALGAAIYLVEYAKQGPFVTLLRFATETLAGIPSIILGLFGFLIFVTQFGEGQRWGFTRLGGALTLVLLNLPLLLRVSEDALRSVPNDLREASFAVGANRVKTVFRVLVPTSLPALTTGIILTAGKMMGETAALIFTAGASSSINNWLNLNPFASGETLTVHLYTLQSEGLGPNVKALSNGTAAVLILLLLLFNLGIRWIAAAITRRVSGRR
jgi:phosphate transport system permease protein